MRSTLQDPGAELALVQLPARMRRALRTFRRITSLSAVTSLSTSLPASGKPSSLSPPIHPRCAKRLRSVRAAPCRRQWLIHLSSSRRSPAVISHICPLGLRCSFVPIQFDGRLVGVAKLVADSGTPEADFLLATGVLKLAVAGACQDSLVSVLSEQVGELRQCVTGLQQSRLKGGPVVNCAGPTDATPATGNAEFENVRLVEKTLAYLQAHYKEPGVSLPVVAGILGCNPNYLTTRFTQVVGGHMHTYLIALRIAWASRLLIETSLSVKETAYASGFTGPTPLARAFHRQIGVSPGQYRRIFAAR
jgi:AraC-like DNA-binding protein